MIIVNPYEKQLLFNNIYSNKCKILLFTYDKHSLHVSAYQAIIRAPIVKNTENTASQNK
jgi:hypothetical protein